MRRVVLVLADGIPHFIHSRFYCYAYVFGELLVRSLYRRYLDEGDAFVPRYLELLGAGGGGFLLLFASPEDHAAITDALPDLRRIPFQFEPQGSRIIYVEE